MTDEFAEIRQAYALESAEMLAELESALLALENLPVVGDDFNRLFRAVHTIKGSSSIVSADHVESFCHALEHLLVKVREDQLPLSRELIGLLLHCHDHIRTLITAFEANSTELPPQHAQILASIATWQSHHEEACRRPDDEGLPLYQEDAFIDTSSTAQKVVRVDALKLDQLINLVVELVTASSELESHVKQLGDGASLEAASSVSLLVKKIQERTMVFRMVPVGDLFRRFQRLVHDLSASTGKQIHLSTSGLETELDKVMAERLREPLVHLVRNAIDHGIELPHERQAAGKPATGTVSLHAFQETGCIVIEVRDDGRGINHEQVLRHAVERGLISHQEAAERDPLDLIFEPGFSTLDEATLLSGRGVGMDVVRRTIEELRGKIVVTSTMGVGSTFQLRLPLSLALIDGFMVMLGNDSYIMPMELVDETIDLPLQSRRELNQRGYLNIRGEALPCLDLKRALQSGQLGQEGSFAVVVRLNGRRVGLTVDRLVGEVKAVIKPLGRIYRNARLISGATILGDGTIALILDLPELVRLYDSQMSL